MTTQTTTPIDFEAAENALHKLMATITHSCVATFPGLDDLRLESGDVRGGVLAMAWTCAMRRVGGEIDEKREGQLEALHAYGVVDCDVLSDYVRQWHADRLGPGAD